MCSCMRYGSVSLWMPTTLSVQVSGNISNDFSTTQGSGAGTPIPNPRSPRRMSGTRSGGPGCAPNWTHALRGYTA
jgi:hypothetical protein